MEIYRSKFIYRTLNEKYKIILSTWLSETESMNENEFKKEMLSLIDLIKKYHALYVLSDLTAMKYAIKPALQNWIAETLTPEFIKYGIKKQAIILPNDIFSLVSMEQTINDVESVEHKHQTKYFGNIESAEKWLYL